MGISLANTGYEEEAIDFLKKSLKVSRSDSENLQINTTLADYYYTKLNLEKGRQYFNAAIAGVENNGVIAEKIAQEMTIRINWSKNEIDFGKCKNANIQLNKARNLLKKIKNLKISDERLERSLVILSKTKNDLIDTEARINHCVDWQ